MRYVAGRWSWPPGPGAKLTQQIVGRKGAHQVRDVVLHRRLEPAAAQLDTPIRRGCIACRRPPTAWWRHIARAVRDYAFALRPPILLADEPTGNLDTATGAAVLELLLAMNREQGTTMVMVTHEQNLAASADRRIVLRDGLVVSQ